MSALAGRSVLVTGAGGFIGSHLVEHLLAEGARVSALVRYNSMNDWRLLRELAPTHLRAVRVLEGDVRDAMFVRKTCEGIDVVFHLAAAISIPHSYRAPADFVQTNVAGTANVLAAASECGCSRIICTSTSEVYGTAERVPMDESHPLRPQSPYAASKTGADMLAISYALSFDAPVVLIRPFNTYGPRQSARAIIPTIVSQLIAGDEVRAGDTSTRRDFTFVTDTVRGFIAAALTNEAIGGVFNLGTGRSVSIQDVIDTAATILGRNPRVVREEERVRPDRSEVRLLEADAGSAARVLGWKPEIDLEEGLRRTIEYIRPRLERYRPGEYLR